MRQYNAFAPANIWGDWKNIANNMGKVMYTVTATAIGSTLITGEIKYCIETGMKTETFFDSVVITTGECVGTVEVRFKGNPTGSAVEGTISP